MKFTIDTDTLYHTTESENVESILKDGLLRCNMHGNSSFISLSLNPLSWRRAGWKGKDQVTFEIDLVQLELFGIKNKITTTFLPDLDEVLYWGDIKPEFLRIVEIPGFGKKGGQE